MHTIIIVLTSTADVPRVIGRLALGGFQLREYLKSIHTITGLMPTSIPLDELRGIDGVASIELIQPVKPS